jgi:excisionase family DNA binding protein
VSETTPDVLLPLAAASLRLRRPPGRPRKQTPRPGGAAARSTAEPRPGDEARPLPPRAPAFGPTRLLSARETARYLGLAYDTVLSLVKGGTLRPVRLPLGGGELRKLLFDRADLDRLVEASKA